MAHEYTSSLILICILHFSWVWTDFEYLPSLLIQEMSFAPTNAPLSLPFPTPAAMFAPPSYAPYSTASATNALQQSSQSCAAQYASSLPLTNPITNNDGMCNQKSSEYSMKHHNSVRIDFEKSIAPMNQPTAQPLIPTQIPHPRQYQQQQVIIAIGFGRNHRFLIWAYSRTISERRRKKININTNHGCVSFDLYCAVRIIQ